MRKNLLKHLTLALLLTAAVPTLTAQVHVGDILCEGNAIISPANYSSSGATAIGVVFYVDNTGQHGWAVALEDAGSYTWGSHSDTPLPNFSSVRQAIYDLDGYENTRIVREHNTNHAAFYAVDFENGWYIPTIGQLNYLYGNIIEVNETIAVVGGTIFSSFAFWSSTETDAYSAWYFMSNGELSNYWNANGYGYCYHSKDDHFGVRAVRNF